MRSWLWPQFRLPQRRHREPPALRSMRMGQRRYRVGQLVRAPSRRRLPRLPWRRMALTTLAVASVVGGVYGVYALLDGDALRVRHADVVGAEIADPHAVVAAADVGGRSQFALETGPAAQRVVETLPEVKAATVRRAWPQGVVIEVTEHQGWGHWQAGGWRVVIDADGLVIPQGRPPAADAVTIFEIGASRPLEAGDVTDLDTVHVVASLLADARSQRVGITPERFEFHADRGLIVRVAGGPDVVFGDSHSYGFKVAAWGSLLDRIERERIEVAQIDLRFGRQLVLR